MSWSIVFALPKQLRTMLSAAPALGGVQVTTGPRRTPAGSKELAVQELRAPVSRPVTGGTRREEGSFVLRAYWEVTGAGEDAIDAVRDEVDAILEAASDVIEADYTLGGLVLFCDVTDVAEDDQALLTDGRTFTAHMTVSFTADVDPGA